MWEKFKKFIAYRVKESIDSTHIRHLREFDDARKQHQEELNTFWDRMSPEKRHSLLEPFLGELKKEWPREFSEVQLKEIVQDASQRIYQALQIALLAGYMTGKGWISMEQLSDVNLHLGDNLAVDIRHILKKAKSRGVAFASAFASVAAEGHLAALADGD